MHKYPSVTFETKCWEKDWRFLLTTKRLEKVINRCDFNFTRRTLFINNVADYLKVSLHADRLIKRGILTEYYIVTDYAQEALDFFQLSKELLGKGYIYSVSELVSIYLCQTDFLLHFSSDTFPFKKSDWIKKALNDFNKNKQVKVANPVWSHKYNEAQKESFQETEDFYIGYGFSDQCYLIRTKDFRAPIYNEIHPESERYPEYGGDLFEKRVDSWMRNNSYQRITYKHTTYVHNNFPKRRFRRVKKLIGMRFGLID